MKKYLVINASRQAQSISRFLTALIMVPLLFMISSCGNDEGLSLSGGSKKIESSKLSTASSPTSSPGGEGSGTWITYTNGNYISSFGGGISFGGSFPHPTGGNNGDPVYISEGVTFTGGGGYVETNAEHLIVILLNPIQYQSGVVTISFSAATEEFDIEVADGEEFQNPAAAGRVVVDHSSPTNMSIVPESFTENTITPPTVTTFLLGVLTQNGVKFYMYGPDPQYNSGTVYRVTAVNARTGDPVIVNSFSLTYQLTSDGAYYYVYGSLAYSGGTINVNSNILAP